MLSAKQALDRLREGNRRFASGTSEPGALRDATRRAETAAEQAPFAIVLGCSDSRVPAEIVFDQGLGDLFVIRVAGNIVAPSLLGSAEFAALRFGTRLVAVLGHTNCGAVLATLEALRGVDPPASSNLSSIVECVSPCLRPLLEADPPHDTAAILARAVRANVSASAARLRSESQILGRLMRDEGLRVVGAEYCLETGLVDFFDPFDLDVREPD